MHWRTRLIHSQAQAPGGFRSLATPTYRGSTVVFEKQGDVFDDWHQKERGYSYGLYGTPTVLEFGARIAEIEGAQHSFVVPGGQAAIALVYFAFCRAGSHVLIPASAYGPNKEMAEDFFGSFGITAETYEPSTDSAITDLIRPETSLVWCESPGSITMDVQDVPAIVKAAHTRGVPVALDNSYAAGVLFDAFRHGVDVSVQAITKYVGGHSDLILGTVSVRDEPAYAAVGRAYGHIGMAVSPDDCSLALRGLQTLGIRLKQMESSTLEVARWLAGQPAVESVLHPALPSCPGHVHWKRDFHGSAGVFSFVFDRSHTAQQVAAFVNDLKLFKIGHSWGGVTSLVMAYPDLHRPGQDHGDRLVRLNVGLEEPEDLIADLKQAMWVFK